MLDNTDNIQSFIFENADIRGHIVHLDNTLKEILVPHQYPKSIELLLTEAILSASLMSATIKYSGQLTIQFQSKGPLQLLLVKCSDTFQMRALAQFDEDVSDEKLVDCFKQGELVVTLEADSNNKPYQSIVPIKHSIKESLAFYFSQSEQLPTHFWFASAEHSATGMLLQQLPEKENRNEDRDEVWQNALTLAETIREEELLTLPNEELLFRLYHEKQVRLFDSKPVAFHCPCDRSRMLEAVKVMGKDEVSDIYKTHKTIDVTCEFCKEYYAFDKTDTSYLFHNQ
jgi:molecular chaperone Hsp33